MRTEEVLEQVETAPRFTRVKLHEFTAKAVDEETRTISGLASTPVKDLQDEIVQPTAFSHGLPDYLRLPTVTWMHDPWIVPPGHTEQAEVQDEGLFVRIHINETELGQDIWQAIKAGSLRALSIGFDGEYTPEWGYFDEEKAAWVWTRVSLREIAIVSLPANREATFGLAKTLGLEMKMFTPPTKDEIEEARVEEDLTRLKGSAEAVHNILRHWAKSGGAPSARLVDAAVSPITALAGIVKAGPALSGASEKAVADAIEALGGTLDGKDEGNAPSPQPSPEGRGGDGQGKAHIRVSRPAKRVVAITR